MSQSIPRALRQNGGSGEPESRNRISKTTEIKANGMADNPRLEQRASFPNSVFSAGTAKRTAEMLGRKKGPGIPGRSVGGEGGCYGETETSGEVKTS